VQLYERAVPFPGSQGDVSVLHQGVAGTSLQLIKLAFPESSEVPAWPIFIEYLKVEGTHHDHESNSLLLAGLPKTMTKSFAQMLLEL